MKYKVTLNGRTYEVEVEHGKAMLLDEYEAIAPAPVAAAPVAGEAVTAPMPGTILKVNVQNGQAVKEGDVLEIRGCPDQLHMLVSDPNWYLRRLRDRGIVTSGPGHRQD